MMIIAEELIKSIGVEPGDTIEIIADKVYTGILIPKHRFSGQDIITIKLSNGYNIGIKVNDDTVVNLINKKEKKKIQQYTISKYDKEKKFISVISTGGTIVSYVDYKTGAVHPALTTEELIYSLPEIVEKYNINAEILFTLLSEDIKPFHWQELSKKIANSFNEGSKAVIVPHGTDTIGYTSTALSFMLKQLTGPVILVGSQRSSDRPSSDAYMNIEHCMKLIETDLSEVVVLMHGSSSDDFSYVHRGTRIRKMHTSKRDAFQSINSQPICKIDETGVIFLSDYRKKTENREVIADTVLEQNVALIYYYPSLSQDMFEYILKKHKGVVIAGTGLGHISTELLEVIKNSDIPIVMTSQCIYGRINLNVYSRGRELIENKVIPGFDMLPEVALVKLMYVLGKTNEYKKIKELMLTNMVGEINL